MQCNMASGKPTDRCRSMINLVHKKGCKLTLSSYQAIFLISIPGKVFCKMILMRTDDNIDTHLSKKQYGFRKNRGTEDAIFIVQQIMEKTNEHQVPLHLDFFYFKAAFDTIWIGALWKMLRSIGVDPTITSLIECMINIECAVVINGQLTE